MGGVDGLTYRRWDKKFRKGTSIFVILAQSNVKLLAINKMVIVPEYLELYNRYDECGLFDEIFESRHRT